MKNRDKISASKQLDIKAEQLEQRHQKRLNAITETALMTSSRRSLNLFASQPVLAFATLVLAVSVYWMLPPSENNTLPSAPQMAIIPDWVLDDQVPLELLESPEFYQWLAKQKPIHQTMQQG